MSIYNEDELVAPSWLNEEFFVRVLAQHEKDEDVQIAKLELSPASMKGDHYASVMFRAKVDYRFSADGPCKHIALVIKTIPEEEGMKRDMLQQSEFFETEIKAYGKTLPEIERILAKYGDNTRFAPKMIYYALQPNKVIILEDLCELGYNPLRTRHFNEDEVHMVLDKLAKFHAVTYMLGQSERHEEVTAYKVGLFNNSALLLNPLMAGGVTRFIEMLSAYDELEEYIPKLKALEGEIIGACQELYRCYQNGATGEIFVLNHGDFHLKNLMLKYNKKTILDDVLMVDFQLSVYAPSAIDLMYSFFMLLSPEYRLNMRDQFTHYYFERFIATLKLIEYQGTLPKFADLKISFIRYRHFAVYLLCTFLPLMSAMLVPDPETLPDMKALEDPDAIGLFYRNPALLAELKNLLPRLLHDGYLD